MFYSDDPVLDFEMYDREQAKQLEKLPVCEVCGNPIQDDFYFEINDAIICECCLNEHHRKRTEDFIS